MKNKKNSGNINFNVVKETIITLKVDNESRDYFEYKMATNDWKETQSITFNKIFQNLQERYGPDEMNLEKAKEILTTEVVVSESFKSSLGFINKFIQQKGIINEYANKYGDVDIISDVETINSNQLTIKYILIKKPEIDLKLLNNIFITMPKKSRVVEADVNNYIKGFLRQHLKLIPFRNDEKKAKNGYVAKIDFKGEINGKEFTGGTATDFDIEIGSKNFIPELNKALVDMKKNDEKKVNVVFAKDYAVEDLRLKKAVFFLKLKLLSKIEIPKLTTEFLRDLELGIDMNSVESFRNFAKENLIHNAKKSVELLLQEVVFTNIYKQYKNIEISPDIIEAETFQVKNNFTEEAKKFKIRPEFLAKRIKIKEKNYVDYCKRIAKTRIVVSYIIRKFVNTNNIIITKAELEGALRENGILASNEKLSKISDADKPEYASIRESISYKRGLEEVIKLVRDQSLKKENKKGEKA